MGDKIFFAVEEKMGIVNETNISYLTSQHLKRYHKNMAELKKKHAWKTEGSGATFMGAHNPMAHYSSENVNAKINGISAMNKEGKILYSLTVDEFSGIYIKNPLDDGEMEGLVTSDKDTKFFNIDYNERSEKIVASVGEGYLEKHIALLNVNSGGYNILTEGESIDDNPCWSKVDKNVIYYDSAGIALNTSGEFGGIGTKSILKLDISSGELEEVISIKKYDCFKPVEDMEGNLYFIKRPLEEIKSKSNSLKDLILIPFKLSKAIFGWMNFFTAKYTGDTLITSGQNPAKGKEKTEEEIFIEGNLINAVKTLKENQAAGESFPGVAPRNWELVKKGVSGEIKVVKKGVIDFDINNKGEILYSNGKYILKIDKNSEEEVLGKVNLVSKVRAI